MDIWNLVAERKIREAMDEGLFDRLDGAGEPLNLDENPFEDPSDRMAHRLLKNNGLAPAWILEGKEIEQEAFHLRAEGERVEPAEYQKRIERLNRRIADYNLKVPLTSLHKQLY